MADNIVVEESRLFAPDRRETAMALWSLSGESQGLTETDRDAKPFFIF